MNIQSLHLVYWFIRCIE